MFIDVVKAGLFALQDYVATHVLTCLVPAFFLGVPLMTQVLSMKH